MAHDDMPASATHGGWGRLGRGRVVVIITVLALVAAGVYLSQDSTGQAAQAPRTARADRGDVTLTVGGVGRIVTAGTTASVVPVSTTAGSTGASSGTPAPPDAVFPRTPGSVGRLLVRPGDQVISGQPLAILDDAAALSTAVQQAEDDLATARLGLQRALDPLSPAETSAARLEVRRAAADLETLQGGTATDQVRARKAAARNVTLARYRLRLVLHPRTAADIAAARADVSRAEADLAALTSPAPPASAAAVAAARAAVDAARAKLAVVNGPPDPAAVAAARLEVARTENDLAVLLAASTPPTPTELATARAAVDAATTHLQQLLGPPPAADVAAAQADLRKAEAELDALLSPAVAPGAAALAAARSALDAARAKLSLLVARPTAADVSAARLELTRARTEQAALRRGPAPAALAAARTAVATARTRLSTPGNPLDVQAARVLVTASGSRLSAARVAEGLLTVRSPRSGTVTTLFTRAGSQVDATTPVATVSDLSRLAVDVDVSEFDAAQVTAGMRAVLHIDALGGQAYPGNVRFVSQTGTDNGGVVTFPVRIALASADGVKAGMNVSIRIVVDERRDVVRVPLEAVSTGDGGRTTVTVMDAAGSTSRRTVKLGLADNKVVEVVDGLRPGQRVVLKAGGSGA